MRPAMGACWRRHRALRYRRRPPVRIRRRSRSWTRARFSLGSPSIGSMASPCRMTCGSCCRTATSWPRAAESDWSWTRTGLRGWTPPDWARPCDPTRTPLANLRARAEVCRLTAFVAVDGAAQYLGYWRGPSRRKVASSPAHGPRRRRAVPPLRLINLRRGRARASLRPRRLPGPARLVPIAGHPDRLGKPQPVDLPPREAAAQGAAPPATSSAIAARCSPQ